MIRAENELGYVNVTIYSNHVNLRTFEDEDCIAKIYNNRRRPDIGGLFSNRVSVSAIAVLVNIPKRSCYQKKEILRKIDEGVHQNNFTFLNFFFSCHLTISKLSFAKMFYRSNLYIRSISLSVSLINC